MATLSMDTKVAMPQWNGERKDFSVYDWQFRNFAAMSSLTDALDATLMANCPTKSEYMALDKTSTDPTVVSKIKLWKDNEKLCGIFVCGNNSAVGKAAIQATVSTDFPLGKIHLALEGLQKSYLPDDTTAEIDMELAVSRVRFKNGQAYYAEVMGVLANFTCTMTDKELIKDMAKKTNNTTYVRMISDELKKPSPNFKSICDELDNIQRLAQVSLTGSDKPKDTTKKEVSLANADGGKGKCSHCGGAHKRKECNKLKAALEKQGDCPHCDKSGHLASECFVKHPEKKPSWFGKKKQSGKKSNEASMAEIQVANLDFA